MYRHLSEIFSHNSPREIQVMLLFDLPPLFIQRRHTFYKHGTFHPIPFIGRAWFHRMKSSLVYNNKKICQEIFLRLESFQRLLYEIFSNRYSLLKYFRITSPAPQTGVTAFWGYNACSKEQCCLRRYPPLTPEGDPLQAILAKDLRGIFLGSKKTRKNLLTRLLQRNILNSVSTCEINMHP